MLSEKIAIERKKRKLTQEDLAEQLNVSRQSIQKWENGIARPTMEKTIMLAKIFGTSIDYLCKDDNYIQVDGGRTSTELQPLYAHIHAWESYAKSLKIEYMQCVDEGLDMQNYKDLFAAVENLPDDIYKEEISDTVF